MNIIFNSKPSSHLMPNCVAERRLVAKGPATRGAATNAKLTCTTCPTRSSREYAPLGGSSCPRRATGRASLARFMSMPPRNAYRSNTTCEFARGRHAARPEEDGSNNCCRCPNDRSRSHFEKLTNGLALRKKKI